MKAKALRSIATAAGGLGVGFLVGPAVRASLPDRWFLGVAACCSIISLFVGIVAHFGAITEVCTDKIWSQIGRDSWSA